MGEVVSLDLDLLPDHYAIEKTTHIANFEQLCATSEFCVMIMDRGLISLIRKIDSPPRDSDAVSWPWRALRIRGRLDFSLSGVLLSALNPLATSEVSVLVTSTFDTDVIFVKEEMLDVATNALISAGHRIFQNRKAE